MGRGRDAEKSPMVVRASCKAFRRSLPIPRQSPGGKDIAHHVAGWPKAVTARFGRLAQTFLLTSALSPSTTSRSKSGFLVVARSRDGATPRDPRSQYSSTSCELVAGAGDRATTSCLKSRLIHWLGRVILRPVFQPEARHAAEFADIVGHKSCAQAECMGRDQHVIGADLRACAFKICPQLCIVTRHGLAGADLSFQVCDRRLTHPFCTRLFIPGPRIPQAIHLQ